MNKRTILLLIASLTLIGCTDRRAPTVVINTPEQGATVTNPVLVTGEASDGPTGFDKGKVRRLFYTLNQGSEQELPAEDRESVPFSFQLSGLVPGSNVIRVTAIDAASNQGYAEVTVNYQPPSGPSGIRASVRDARTNQPVADVAIAVTSGGSPVASTVTYQGEGNYEINVPAGQNYSVQFSRQGYLPAVYSNVAVAAGEMAQLEALLYIPQGGTGSGNASGTISDALTGQGASGATLTLRAGIGVTSGTTVGTTTTGTNGSYSFMNLAAGYYTAEIAKSGYVTGYRTIIVLGGETTGNQNASITPILPEGQTRIVLTWGANPRDLDSHLTGPRADGTGRFHVYFGSSRYQHNSTTYAELDVDDTSSYGPETITIHQRSAGDYVYSVHDYTNRSSTTSTALANSSAQVRVYRGGSQAVLTFNVPTQGTGTLWTVFRMNGGNIVPVNSLTNHADPSSVQSIPLSRSLREELSLFGALPSKQ